MERYFPDATISGNVLKDDLDIKASNGAGADVKRLLEMADAVTKGVVPSVGRTTSSTK
jgi:hypothetical protein